MKTFLRFLQAFIPGSIDEHLKIIGDLSIIMAILNVFIFDDIEQAKLNALVSFIAWGVGLLVWYIKSVLGKDRSN
jgi:hypothetical protein